MLPMSKIYQSFLSSNFFYKSVKDNLTNFKVWPIQYLISTVSAAITIRQLENFLNTSSILDFTARPQSKIMVQ